MENVLGQSGASRHRLVRAVSLILMLLVSIAALGSFTTPADAAKKSKTPRVTIRTTEYGIPRILADNMKGIGYGYGYAIAREQLCTLADTYVTTRGERSRFFGGSADSPDGVSNLDSDFFWKRIRKEGTVAKLVRQKPPAGPEPQAKQAIKAYVQGYNKYLKQTGVKNISDPRCKGKPWVRPITVSDAYHRFYQLVLIGSAGASIDGIAGAQPPLAPASAAEYDAPENPSARVTPEDFEDMGSPTGRLGSNAVGIGSAEKSGKGGLLLGNPHFPWHGDLRFFQSQITIPGKVNVSGASLLGLPVILIGHTQNLAWSHTVSTARRFMVFQEKLDPTDPTRYVVDGQTKQMKATTVTVQNKRDDGTMANETRTLYSTVHGPVLNSVQGTPLFGWTSTTAYSLGDANSSNFRLINHFFEINQAQSTKKVLSILKKYQGIPWVNTIASDSKGNALYADIGSVPNVTDEKVEQCGTPGLGDVAWTTQRLAVFDGSDPACQLDTKEKGAAGKGLLPASKMPFMQRKDYVENSNDSYWLTNVKKPLEGYGRIIGEERIPQSERTRLAHKMVNEIIAGKGKMSLAKLKKMEFNDRVESAELWADELVTYCEANPTMVGESGPVDVSAACPVIKNWDKRNNLKSKGSIFWGQFVLNVFYNGAGALPVYSNPFDFNDPIGTPFGLNTANPDIAKALADTVKTFNDQGIPLDAETGKYQYVVRNGKKIPLHGGEYEPVGSFNPVSGPWTPGKGITEINSGSSFIIAADLTGKKCPKVNTILTYSQSENPKSKHYADQTRLLSKKGWVTDRFCPQQQKKSPGLKVKNFGGGAKAAKRGF